jgi:hypothetical protein
MKTKMNTSKRKQKSDNIVPNVEHDTSNSKRSRQLHEPAVVEEFKKLIEDPKTTVKFFQSFYLKSYYN